MRYIKIYESFESNIISNVIKYFSRKLLPDASSHFLDSLKVLMSLFNIPISRISDEYIDYMRRDKALLVGENNTVNNIFGIYCIKFWFNYKGGFVGITGVGNYRVDFGENIIENKFYNENDINYIKKILNVEKGLLIPFLNDDFQGDAILTIKGIILIVTIVKSSNYLYAIHNNPILDGSTPNEKSYLNNEMVRWRDFGDYSWCLGNRLSKSNRPLKYIKSDEDLKLVYISDKLFDFNLPFSFRKLVKWSDNMYMYYDIKKSDFCIIFYIDRMISKEGYKTHSEIKINRLKLE